MYLNTAYVRFTAELVREALQVGESVRQPATSGALPFGLWTLDLQGLPCKVFCYILHDSAAVLASWAGADGVCLCQRPYRTGSSLAKNLLLEMSCRSSGCEPKSRRYLKDTPEGGAASLCQEGQTGTATAVNADVACW